MQRITEPELMDDTAQAEVYAAADFGDAHSRIVEAFTRYFATDRIAGPVLDLGCGPGDISFRFAARFPECSVLGVDGAAAMIRLATERKAQAAACGERVRFIKGRLPGAAIPAVQYAAIISNSLLHHLHDPAVLWETIKQFALSGTRIYIVDLFRPQSAAEARRLVETYAADEPAVLRRDFYNSLCAAFEPHEVEVQLVASGLEGLAVDVISDRHLVVHGVKR